MITVVVFSFDRAFQLDLLLDTIAKYDIHQILEVHVLYSVSNEAFLQGYTSLQQKHRDCYWHQEYVYEGNKFVWPILPGYLHNYYWWIKYKHNRYVKSNFKSCLQNLLQESGHKTIMFLTDDSIFFKDIIIEPGLLNRVVADPNEYCYSLRHGTNLNGGCYSENAFGIEFNRENKHTHPEWSYPFSVDGHIYGTEAIIRLFSRIIFKNPNTLEGNAAYYVKTHKLFTNMVANKNSCLLGFELNRVQTIVNNNNLNISNEYLNELYLNGYKLKINSHLPSIHNFRPEIINVIAEKDNDIILVYES